MNCKLILNNPDESKTFQLKIGDNIIGRDSNSNIQIISEEASRAHAKITLKDNTVTIKDLDSANGTYVNGKKTSHSELSNGDEVIIANQQMRLEIDQSKDAETQSYCPKITSDRSVYATIKAKPVPKAKSRAITSSKNDSAEPQKNKLGFLYKLFKK
jgi:pSer/pThr/pTyr-binding forkhead associated (FHA) protein